jgi:adenylyltransferase/sulfurtransferase
MPSRGDNRPSGRRETVTINRVIDRSRDRYHSLSISSIWEIDQVRRASAVVVGAGALGNEVAKNLAMMGVRRIVLVDRDTVEVANLTRSIFFREEDHGRPKAEVLAERLREVNPEVEVVPLKGDLQEVLGLGVVSRSDLIFSCLDNRLARRILNQMCQKVARPWVDGAMENLLGDVTAFHSDHGPCYECYLTRTDLEILAVATQCSWIARANLELGKVPTVSTMGSIIAALQVQEGLKILHGIVREEQAGQRLVVNCQTNDVYPTRAERKEDCTGHFRFGDVTQVPAWSHRTTTANDLLARYQEETGDLGHVRLGRDIVTGLRCGSCNETESLTLPLRAVDVERARCLSCGLIREPQTTNVVTGEVPWSTWPLARLSIPPLEILEVRGPRECRWYELTGDEPALLSGRSLPLSGAA